jgi:hypothetical protein
MSRKKRKQWTLVMMSADGGRMYQSVRFRHLSRAIRAAEENNSLGTINEMHGCARMRAFYFVIPTEEEKLFDFANFPKARSQT